MVPAIPNMPLPKKSQSPPKLKPATRSRSPPNPQQRQRELGLEIFDLVKRKKKVQVKQFVEDRPMPMNKDLPSARQLASARSIEKRPAQFQPHVVKKSHPYLKNCKSANVFQKKRPSAAKPVVTVK